ncbi:MAG: hypothetical protein ABEJ87_05390 [Candidatus Nanohalobium sp.]
MSLGDYLEKVDNGEDITITDMYRDGEYQAIIEAVEHGNFRGADLEIESDTADEYMSSGGLGAVRNVLEGITSNIWDNNYDRGFGKGKKALENEDDNDLMSRKAQSKDDKAKGVDLGFATGAGVTGLGLSAGSIEVAAGGAGLGILSGYKSAGYQGMRDAEMKEAAEGLESAYGGFQLSIN